MKRHLLRFSQILPFGNAAVQAVSVNYAPALGTLPETQGVTRIENAGYPAATVSGGACRLVSTIAPTAALILALLPESQSAVINFDTLTGDEPQSDIANYLSSFGVGISEVSPGVFHYIKSDGGTVGIHPSSGERCLLWGGNNFADQTFTLNFAQPLTHLSFTRCAQFPVNGGTAYTRWSATVYQGGTIIGSADEAASSVFDPNSIPARTFDFSGTGITSISFSANTDNFAAYGSPGIDDIIMTPVPDPDIDGDGIPNAIDNCPNTPNPDQADADGDRMGDVCDPNPNDGPLSDIDGDGVPNAIDTCSNSDIRPKLDVNGNEPGQTTINNTVNASGCTIQDRVNACAAGARNHGQYVSCMTDLANQLYQAGAITKAQCKEMVTGAAKSNIGK